VALGTAAAFWAVSLLFVITPGADWAYAIAAGLRHRTVVPAVGGLLAGHLLATVVVAAGVAALVAGSPAVLIALTVTGAAIWSGWVPGCYAVPPRRRRPTPAPSRVRGCGRPPPGSASAA
jgi:threonine/homoserine/homoserine lactone efflux protein